MIMKVTTPPMPSTAKILIKIGNKLEFPFSVSDVEHPLFRAMKSVAIDIDDDEINIHL